MHPSLFPSPDIRGRKDWGLVFHSEIWEPGLHPDLKRVFGGRQIWETEVVGRMDRKQNSSLEVFRREEGPMGSWSGRNLLTSIGMVPGCWLWCPISRLQTPLSPENAAYRSWKPVWPEFFLLANTTVPHGHLLEGNPPSGEQNYSHWILH